VLDETGGKDFDMLSEWQLNPAQHRQSQLSTERLASASTHSDEFASANSELYLLSVITTIQSQFSYGYMTSDITIVNEAGKRLAIETSQS
jgi:hypothetical protein